MGSTKKTKRKILLERKLFFLLPFGIASCFFLVAIFTMKDYGMNWDSPIHFARGHAFLRYLLTGKTNYDGVPKQCIGKDGYLSRVDYKTKEVCDLNRKTRVSEYESTTLDFNFFQNRVYGHPPTSDIFLALSNTIFFKLLGLVEDIHAYHIYSLFSAFLLALVVAAWVRMTFGTFAAIIAVLSVYTFPLLFGEQQFNVKDPTMAAFFTFSLFLFWMAIIKKSWKLMVASAVAGGISFGTKFNFVFAPFILFPWFLLYLGSKVFQGMKEEKRQGVKGFLQYSKQHLPVKLTFSLLVYPFIVFLIFYISWPALWPAPLKNIVLVVRFYQDVGGSTCQYMPFTYIWVAKCSDILPLIYFVTTVPLVTLFFFSVGFFAAIKKYRSHSLVIVLWVTFIIFILGRVTLPFSKTYGGLRQILEFIAPMSMLAGAGALWIRDYLVILWKRKHLLNGVFDDRILLLFSSLLFLSFLPILINLYQLHPNENVYFNELVGGLKGAAQRDLPGYGNTYGNVYFQGVQWINEHAEKDAKLSLVTGLGQNISRFSLRPDISFYNAHRSDYEQEGEYQVVLQVQGDPSTNWFRYKYVNKFLDPVYDLAVDGVSLLRIWKNDKLHIKRGINIKDEELQLFELSYANGVVVLTLPSTKRIKRLEFHYTNNACLDSILTAPIFISEDGSNFFPMPEVVNDLTLEEIQKNIVNRAFFFTGESVKAVQIALLKNKRCDPREITYSIYSFRNLYTKE